MNFLKAHAGGDNKLGINGVLFVTHILTVGQAATAESLICTKSTAKG